MENEVKLITGAMVTFAFAVALLLIIPYFQIRDIPAPDGLKPYTTAELRGRQSYIANGCHYCHTQQPRDSSFAPDHTRGWGRAAVPADYVYDRPHLLGSMRTGPDLFNIGVRQPSKDWQLGHLYQPRAYVPDSIMPSFPYLFDVKDEAEADETEVRLPPEYQPEGKVVVATPEALDLVKYLQALKRNYPVIPAEPQ
ncbi:MAG: cbb3-type cytochrome c oxidase subunit II [Ottowia sp.]|nr:cbb3-type cytochrome c oxidase subunit II [Ottowia sp.]